MHQSHCQCTSKRGGGYTKGNFWLGFDFWLGGAVAGMVTFRTENMLNFPSREALFSSNTDIWKFRQRLVRGHP